MTRSPELPAPRESLLSLGLTEAQLDGALQRAPLTWTCQASSAEGAYFDAGRVLRVLRALAAFHHTKGEWAGTPISLEAGGLDPWQVVWILAPVFGWVVDTPTGPVRVVNQAWIEVPRKNGKTLVSSALMLVLLLADGEQGAEVYAAAGSREQAGRVFDDAKAMVLASPAARRRCEVLSSVIRGPEAGIFRALSRVAETAHGLNVSGGTIDEVHTLRLRRALVDAITSGTGARRQPLIFLITTADEDEPGTIYDEWHTLISRLSDGLLSQPDTYGAIWAAEATDDPWAESTWAKANPGLGKSPKLEYLQREAQKAKDQPSRWPAFARLHLNLRVKEDSQWLNIADWDRCSAPVDRQRLRGQRAWAGLDLSATSDFSAWCVLAESPDPGLDLEAWWRLWVPGDRVDDLAKRLGLPIRDWVAAGFVEATAGDVIDYAAIREQITADCRHVFMQRISFDRMFAGQLVQELSSETSAQVVPVAQTFFGLSPACKELERLLGADPARIRVDSNPVARWMAGVAEVKDDGLDNIRPSKPDRRKSLARIDAVQAMVTGLDGWLRRGAPQGSSIITA